MNNHPMDHSHSAAIGWSTILPSFFITAAVFALYFYAAQSSNQRYRQWPIYRYWCFLTGILCSASAVTGPLAHLAHNDFRVHMLGHLLLGMLGPLLIVLSFPVTLALRTLKVQWARRVSRILRSKPVLWISYPVTAAVLNIGGLWLIYMTGLYSAMQQHMLLHILVHFHVFAAGYLFTASIIYTDPAPHRTSYMLRAITMVLAFAGHGILSKLIYAAPPEGIPQDQGEAGGLLMYYGGDFIDLVLIFIFCLQWYRASSSVLHRSGKRKQVGGNPG
ncbi:cytochrome c oxidase assembly protein [Paenibacillus sp. PK3_47]|uniref:cytochrome c oxidase assembly protein n=1 Tax=Paenibacillus sp. PK3_47 TaxID=2072642 RepID=UPI00201D31C8|nr:cytochrome c oxidase assembly protein [Paenibacillus sp. PK3_47]UQZ36928.1 cytochrome c oxidase assembly protein [Paenibacillus sp. PK3_47]